MEESNNGGWNLDLAPWKNVEATLYVFYLVMEGLTRAKCVCIYIYNSK